eukprot:comp6473_c0_seq1/m.2250 comp6473_c0_seq1/g.2250  ORF comp6473_c0_seq1/g.2250 comp6473_c0_seq1/m.2250 type:complete len:359 (-) comp6473_c0_seq1:136-1212(-)
METKPLQEIRANVGITQPHNPKGPPHNALLLKALSKYINSYPLKNNNETQASREPCQDDSDENRIKHNEKLACGEHAVAKPEMAEVPRASEHENQKPPPRDAASVGETTNKSRKNGASRANRWARALDRSKKTDEITASDSEKSEVGKGPAGDSEAKEREENKEEENTKTCRLNSDDVADLAESALTEDVLTFAKSSGENLGCEEGEHGMDYENEHEERGFQEEGIETKHSAEGERGVEGDHPERDVDGAEERSEEEKEGVEGEEVGDLGGVEAGRERGERKGPGTEIPVEQRVPAKGILKVVRVAPEVKKGRRKAKSHKKPICTSKGLRVQFTDNTIFLVTPRVKRRSSRLKLDKNA